MGNKITNFNIICASLIIVVAIIIVASIAKISDKHNEKLLYSMESNVEYYAKRCYLENNCVDETTLKDLYEKKYLTEVVVNPVTKEILDENIKINFVDNKIVINWE